MKGIFIHIISPCHHLEWKECILESYMVANFIFCCFLLIHAHQLYMMDEKSNCIPIL